MFWLKLLERECEDEKMFSLLYTPCVAAVASVKRELGTKWAVGMVFWQCLIAWVVAIIMRGIGMLLF